MDTVNFASSANGAIGQVFTPLSWADWAIEKGPYADWLAGGTILDPTGGAGVFLEAFISRAISEDRTITQDMLNRLFMVERDAELCQAAIDRCKSRYGVELPESNILNEDFFRVTSRINATSIVGNPPWINFVDLPNAYKDFVKPFFVKYGLVPDLRRVLWGGSRIDLAAAVLAKCVRDHCADSATIVFYLPLSLFMNDGAHQAFRDLSFRQQCFRIEELHDLSQRGVFPEVSTRYCLAKLRKGGNTSFPINFWIHESGRKTRCEHAKPFSQENNALTIGDLPDAPVIRVPRASLPRQGVNTCGANERFFFDTAEWQSDGVCVVSNKSSAVRLEDSLVFPLITGKNFANGPLQAKVCKHVFLPYDRHTGKPLDSTELEQRFPLAWAYLLSISDQLQNRKGTMLGQHIAKGRWWSLLGVGRYTFAPYKIVWQAYGQNEFRPELFTSEWIPNQSLQASMSFDDLQAANQVLQSLRDANLTAYLRSGQMAGTASWAQPGKIKMFLEATDNDSQLPLFDVLDFDPEKAITLP